jgi:hypothetical protein
MRYRFSASSIDKRPLAVVRELVGLRIICRCMRCFPRTVTARTHLCVAASCIIDRRSPPAQYSRTMNLSFWSKPIPLKPTMFGCAKVLSNAISFSASCVACAIFDVCLKDLTANSYKKVHVHRIVSVLPHLQFMSIVLIPGNTYLSIFPGLDQFDDSKPTFTQDPDRGEVFSQGIHIKLQNVLDEILVGSSNNGVTETSKGNRMDQGCGLNTLTQHNKCLYYESQVRSNAKRGRKIRGRTP